MPNPSLDALEAAVAAGEREAAFAQVLAILGSVNERYGRVGAIEGFGLVAERRLEQTATRFSAAFGRLVCDLSQPIPPAVFEQLTAHHRWIELMFLVGGFGSADHLVPLLAVDERRGRRVPPQNLARFLLLFSAAAGMKMSLDECLAADDAASVAAFLGYLGSRFCFTDEAHALRERLLEWLPERLAQVKLGGIALHAMASPYMHCSYASGPRKHAIKAALIAQARRVCLEAGCAECETASASGTRNGKPVLVVTCENFTPGHSVWRTHSRAVEALRASFHVVGALYPQHRTPEVEAAFDEVLTFKTDVWFLDAMRALTGEIAARKPAMVLHLGVGMAPYVIALAALRLAPVQAASFGHTATTGSPAIDYMILPDDFVGDPACFGERLVRLDPRAMPYRRRDDVDFAAVRARAAASRTEGPVRIAAPASAMKLGPPFFDALARAAEAASRPVTYEFFPLGCAGLGHAELKRRLAARLPMAEVNEELPYDLYIERLAACDFFVCPFPYGNMNSIVDAVLVGLPGVCLDGAEAHAHADAAYFRRLGFPAELVAQDVDAYVAAVARLASDGAWLGRRREHAAKADLDAAFFDGDARLFAAAMKDLAARGALTP